MKPLTEDEWNMLDYFWNDKGDLSRWCGWEEFVASHPHHPVVDAWNRYQSASDALTMLIRGGRP